MGRDGPLPQDDPEVNPLVRALRHIAALDPDAGLDEAKAVAVAALVDRP